MDKDIELSREIFLDKLRELGYMVKADGKQSNQYLIRDSGPDSFGLKAVNIRSTSMEKSPKGGRKYWYDVSISTFEVSNFFIYLTTGPYFGFCIPSNILKAVFEKMYKSSRNPNRNNFEIAWDDEYIYFSDGTDLNLRDYYFRLEEIDGDPIVPPKIQ